MFVVALLCAWSLGEVSVEGQVHGGLLYLLVVFEESVCVCCQWGLWLPACGVVVFRMVLAQICVEVFVCLEWCWLRFVWRCLGCEVVVLLHVFCCVWCVSGLRMGAVASVWVRASGCVNFFLCCDASILV